MHPCSLLSLATAVPPQKVSQAEAKERARRAFGGNKALFDRLSGVFDNAGIATRHIVAPPQWYEEHHGWADRNAVYLEATEKLFEEAAAKAIEREPLGPTRSTFASSASRATPKSPGYWAIQESSTPRMAWLRLGAVSAAHPEPGFPA